MSKCEACRGVKGRYNETKAQKSEVDFPLQLLGISNKLGSLMTLPSVIGGGGGGTIEKSVQVLSDAFDDFQRRLLEQKISTKELTKRENLLENVGSLNKLTQIRQDLDNLEWHSRRLNVEIHGIPETKNEDLMNKIYELAKTLNVPPMARSDISALHGLPAKPGETQGAIVRFTSQEPRDSWLLKRQTLKKVKDNIYICENITRFSRTLLSATRQWAQKSGYAFVWHGNGKVLVRKQNGDRAVVIPHSGDEDTDFAATAGCRDRRTTQQLRALQLTFQYLAS
ncbi:uncharacterized protein LOC121838488 [Ixodes scapularis]|uniref:uncharacterized protein LOC121838488 n=1 Tax=Ixodes scapularis TaxID=6945 RepID=UPI001C393DE2|nr:uncharacterized protein LOC121838488 [Ixodes scapularis]